jgi:hypothetical protein
LDIKIPSQRVKFKLSTKELLEKKKAVKEEEEAAEE